MRPAKTQISPGIRPVWSESLLSAWRKLGSLATHWVHSKDSDQTGRMPRLIWVFGGRTDILLVLSRDGSYNNNLLQYFFLWTRSNRKWHYLLNVPCMLTANYKLIVQPMLQLFKKVIFLVYFPWSYCYCQNSCSSTVLPVALKWASSR